MVYVAFLRGINVGGKHLVRMSDLSGCFESLGCSKVQTVQASGNVLFTSSARSVQTLTEKLEAGLADRLGFAIPIVIRTYNDLLALVDRAPFQKVTITPHTRCYVSFRKADESALSKAVGKLDGANFQILSVTASEVCSCVELSKQGGTVELMAHLEKQYSKNMTTRNWATVLKCTE